MDTTEQYIKMCEKAGEIRKLNTEHIQRLGELPVNVPYYCDSDCYINLDNLKIIWLPRQDQLQEMCKYFKNLPPAEYSARGLLKAFWEFVDGNWLNYLWVLSNEQVSMEQLWLAFVMKEKYHKIWNGKNWIKEVKHGTKR